MKYRLNRAIAATGICSRRRADELIAEGRVSVNGTKTTDFNFEVDTDNDQLAVDGETISVRQFDYIILYKPVGVVTTRDDEYGRKNVLNLLPKHLQHVNPIGRLDLDSEGMLLLTNDGALAQQLSHPSHTVYKRYQVTVQGVISQKSLDQLAAGVKLEEGMTLPAKVRLIKKAQQNSTLEISIREGRNRQIRRMLATVGHTVQRLVRVAVGALQLKALQPGEWRSLTAEEIRELRSAR